MSQAHNINGELIKLRREERGWVQTDLATRACMSVKQIRQIEEGGISAFYSESVKVSAAKKIAGILGITENDLWTNPEPVHTSEVEAAVSAPIFHASEAQAEAAHSAEPAQQEPVQALHVEEVSVNSATQEATKPKTSLWLIAALFAAALAIAAYMRPEAEPVASEPPPPLQAVPAEATDAASAASSAVEPASADASAPTTAASAAAASKPVVAASVAAPARTASTAATPNAPAASK